MSAYEDNLLPPDPPESTGAAPATEVPTHELPVHQAPMLPEDLRVPWGWTELLIFTLVCIFGAVVLGILFATAYRFMGAAKLGTQKLAADANIIGVWFQIVLDCLILGYLAAQMRLRFRAPFWETIGWRRLEPTLLSRTIAFLGLVVVGFSFDVMVTLISSISPPKKELPIDALFHDRKTALLFMLVAVLIAPLIEETIFRG